MLQHNLRWCTLWQWLPGAAWQHLDRRGRVVEGGPPPPDDATPVEDDLPTQGTLISLVRAYWPRAAAQPAAIGHHGWICWHFPHDGVLRQIARGPTEWAAYAAALLVAEDLEKAYAYAFEAWSAGYAEIGMGHVYHGGSPSDAAIVAQDHMGPQPTRESYGLPPMAPFKLLGEGDPALR